MKRRVLGSLLCWALALPAAGQSECPPDWVDLLEIRLELPASAEIGEPLDAVVTLVRNPGPEGDEAFFVSLRAGRFRLSVTGPDGSRWEAPPLRFSIDREAQRLYRVPLRTGMRLSFELPLPINDPNNISEYGAWLTQVGDYRISALFEDRGDCERDGVGPFWLGRIESEDIPLTLRPADRATVARWRERLAACTRSETCETPGAIGYFRMVRDDTAADLLVELLERNPLAAEVVRAIVFQGRTSDAAELRRIARECGFPAQARWIEEMADRLEAASPPTEP